MELGIYGRLYTGIHALKPKPKSKTGAISESTTALNVDPTKTISGMTGPAVLPLANKGSGVNDQLTTSVPSSESLSVVGASAAIQRKDGLSTTAAKIQVDKKKMDARKKSLKRL